MGGSKKQTVGYWYRPMFHHGLCEAPIDAFLEFRCGDKTAWQGRLTASGQINVNAPNLFGGESDQGGIVGALDVMFGESTQMPNDYLLSALGNQVPGWRGLATVVWRGGRYGAMNPYPAAASYKVFRALKNWANDAPWYTEKAVIDTRNGQLSAQIGETSSGWSYKVVANGSAEDYSAAAYDHSAWPIGASPFASATGHPYAPSGGWPDAVGTTWPINTTLWARRVFTMGKPIEADVVIFVDNFATVWVNGTLVLPRAGSETLPSVESFQHAFVMPASILQVGDNVIALKAEDYGAYSYAAFRMSTSVLTTNGMNLAHVLYQASTDPGMGREPVENLDDANWRAGADWFYANGFGVCTDRDPQNESVDSFRERLQKVGACSVQRSPVDGKLRLNIANGIYDLASLPVITDDDILEFSRQPTTLVGAVNSLSVKFFDPVQKQSITTSPVQAPALIDAFGLIHQVVEYPEIPNVDLALRVAERDLRAKCTPLQSFDLKVMPSAAYALLPDQYVRMQCPKRRIADMVCIVGGKQEGSLKSGAIALQLTQDIYSPPQASVIDAESGTDTSPSQTPIQIALQRAFEAPYIDVVAALSRADLAVLPADVGYAESVASDPAQSRDFTMKVSAGGAYADVDVGQWCPTATVNEAATYDTTSFTLANAKLLAQVVVGAAALWDDEIVRVDAINVAAGTTTLARGCADTVAQQHAANSRLWFWQDGAGNDPTEYTTGESINVKLLTNTGSQQLAEASAIAMPLTFRQRQARPYPPAGFRLFGNLAPQTIAIADIPVSWVARNRVTQADQLVDALAGNITAEAGNTFRLNFYGEASTLTKAYTGLTATGQTWTTEIADSGLYGSMQPVQNFEKFDTSLPAGYGTLYTSATAPAAVFDPSTGAVDLNNVSPSQCYWEITSTPVMTELDMEADVEIVKDYSGSILQAGLWLASAAGSPQGMRLAHHEGNAQKWIATKAPTVGNWTLNELGLTSLAQSTMNIGQRRRLRAVWSAATGLYQLYVDGTKVLEFTDPTFKALRAGIFFFNCMLRVHQVLVRGVSATTRRNNQVRITLDAIVGTLASLQKHDRTLTRVGYGYSYGTQYGGA